MIESLRNLLNIQHTMFLRDKQKINSDYRFRDLTVDLNTFTKVDERLARNITNDSVGIRSNRTPISFTSTFQHTQSQFQ